MDFQKSIKTCLNKFADFKGRASRSEYWYFHLFILLTYIIVIFLSFLHVSLGVVGGILILVMIIPIIAVTARRLHDINKSGWMQLIALPTSILAEFSKSSMGVSYLFSFVTLGLGIYLLFLYVTPGDKRDNKYGKNPLKKRR
tara:strand:- start:36 stop:461 length:426 start_codon:yes stop_codon:yes gene_type:complete